MDKQKKQKKNKKNQSGPCWEFSTEWARWSWTESRLCREGGDVDVEATRVYFRFFSNIQVVETFDQDDEEGDEEVEMVRHSVDNTDLVIFLSEVEVTWLVVEGQIIIIEV